MALILPKYTYKYPHPAVATDCVIFTFHESKLKVLLIERGIEPFKGEWALPGGFLKPDETAERGALRELQEETGLVCERIKQFGVFSDPDRDPRERVISIAFYALVKWERVEGADDAASAEWFDIDRLPPLAFDHTQIIESALKSVRRDMHFAPIGFELLGSLFSMSELQSVYEAITGHTFDRRNFAKKMKHLGVIERFDPEVIKESPECKSEPQPDCASMPDTESLSIDWPHGESNDCLSDIEMSETAGMEQESKSVPSDTDQRLISNCSCLPPYPMARNEKSEKLKKSLKTLFTFNRKKYMKIKDDDFIDF